MTADAWALTGVEEAVAAGFPDGSFRPLGIATQAQAAVLAIVLAHGHPSATTGGS